MERNDMHVVMCQILDYLYECLKDGADPANSEWDAVALGIPESYWSDIVIELVEHNYVKGVMVNSASMVMPIKPQITLEGVSYAQGDKLIVQAREWLVENASPTPTQDATPETRTCHRLPADNYDEMCIVRSHGYEREFGYWKCSECGTNCFEGARYCMNCGAKVVGE